MGHVTGRNVRVFFGVPTLNLSALSRTCENAPENMCAKALWYGTSFVRVSTVFALALFSLPCKFSYYYYSSSLDPTLHCSFPVEESLPSFLRLPILSFRFLNWAFSSACRLLSSSRMEFTSSKVDEDTSSPPSPLSSSLLEDCAISWPVDSTSEGKSRGHNLICPPFGRTLPCTFQKLFVFDCCDVGLSHKGTRTLLPEGEAVKRPTCFDNYQ